MIASSKTFVENYKNWLQFSALKQFNKCQCQNCLHPGVEQGSPVIASHDPIEFVSCFSQLFFPILADWAHARPVLSICTGLSFYFPNMEPHTISNILVSTHPVTQSLPQCRVHIYIAPSLAKRQGHYFEENSFIHHMVGSIQQCVHEIRTL